MAGARNEPHRAWAHTDCELKSPAAPPVTEHNGTSPSRRRTASPPALPYGKPITVPLFAEHLWNGAFQANCQSAVHGFADQIRRLRQLNCKILSVRTDNNEQKNDKKPPGHFASIRARSCRQIGFSYRNWICLRSAIPAIAIRPKGARPKSPGIRFGVSIGRWSFLQLETGLMERSLRESL